MRPAIVCCTALFALGVLAGCSWTGDSEKPLAASPSSISLPEAASEERRVDPLELSDTELEALSPPTTQPSPLGDLLSALGSTDPADQALADEEAIARCMREEGFEYIPAPPPLLPEVVGLASSEYVINATAGYEISTRLGSESTAVEVEWTDPNADYADGLTAEEQEVFQRTRGRCTTNTASALRRSADVEDQELRAALTELRALLSDIDTRLNADPRVLDGWESWSSCMDSQGYRYETRLEIFDEFHQRTDRVVAEIGRGLLNGEILLGDLDTSDRQMLETLQKEELATARADLACRRDLDETINDVRFEIESQAVEQEGQRIRFVIAELLRVQE